MLRPICAVTLPVAVVAAGCAGSAHTGGALTAFGRTVCELRALQALVDGQGVPQYQRSEALQAFEEINDNPTLQLVVTQAPNSCPPMKLQLVLVHGKGYPTAGVVVVRER